jgi:hypothetical protein
MILLQVADPRRVGLFLGRIYFVNPPEMTKCNRVFMSFKQVLLKLCNFSGYFMSINKGRVLSAQKNLRLRCRRQNAAVSTSLYAVADVKGNLVRDKILCHHPPPKGRCLLCRPFF